MLRTIIKKRLSLSGFSQGELAELVGITPAQVSLYLSGKSSLSNDSLEKILEQMDINLNCYNKRLELADQVAKVLYRKKTPSEVITMAKDEMVSLTHIKEISYLIDVESSEDFNAAIGSGLIEADAYYIHFRMIVAHLLQLSDGDITTKKAGQSVCTLNKAIGTLVLTGLAAMGVRTVVALAQHGSGISGRPPGLFSSFIKLASDSLLNKPKKM